ncbi:glycosyltransferase family 2 protein [Mucilaginibacter sp.]|uniref:glycosyltransferase family 2 protein n=1 Tax=Mucilaginibacter sp. TaxID=1882438 RepID=UPI0035BC4E5E
MSLKQYCNEKLFDIIITDNGSTDQSLDAIHARFPELIYIENNENLGFAEGNNRALEYSIAHGYAYSLLINTDTIVDEDFITKLYKHLTDHVAAAAVQPAIYWLHDKSKIWNGKGGFNQVAGMVYSGKNTPTTHDLSTFKNADWLTGCCMLLRNESLSRTGLFNKRFFLYYEDVELSYRLRDFGYELHYLPSAKIYHEAGVSAKVQKPGNEGALSPIIHYYTSRNRLWFLRKYGNPVFWPVYFVSSAAYYLLLFTYFKLRGRSKKAGYLYNGVKEGFLESKKTIWP